MKYFYSLKKLSKTSLSVFVLATALVLGIYACKKPTDGINLIVDTNTLSKAPVLVQFVNANPNSTTPLPNFTISITGPGAGLVQIDGGGTTFTATNGFLPLSLTKDASPSAANPVTFNVYVTAPGFAPVSKTITITKDSIMNTIVPIVEYANPTDGSSSLSNSASLTNNSISSSTSFKTTATATIAQTATLTMAAGTQPLDASGNVITASNLTATVVQFSASNPAAASSSAGTLTATDVVGPGGTVLPGETNFVNAGMLSINVMADNTPVKKFSKPVQVSIDLPAGYINFDTGNPVAAGDMIPLWSQNEQTGQMTYEGTATVVNGANGLSASFSITHLTNWSVQYYYYYNPKNPSLTHNACSSALTLNFHPSTVNPNGTYYVTRALANGQVIAYKLYRPSIDGASIKFYNQPTTTTSKINVYDAGYNLVGTSTALASCATSVDVNYTTPAAPDFVTVTLKISAKCTNKDVVAYPSGWFYINDSNTKQSSAVYLLNGQIKGGSTKMINTHLYTLSTYYSGKTYTSGAFVLNKTAFTLPTLVGLNGKTTFDATTNSLNITADFTLTDCK